MGTLKMGTDFDENPTPELTPAPEAETEEQSETPETPTEETVQEEETPVAPAAEEQPAPAEPPQPSKIKIGETEYSEDELKTIVEKGQKIRDWETKMPGFNVDTFMPDYTRKSQRLAEYEKRLAVKPTPKADLKELGVDEEQVKVFEAVAKNLGYVSKHDLVQDSVEAQKDAFITRHPEYAPGTPVNDQRWADLMTEFSFYNWQSHPQMVEKFLEEAHNRVSPKWTEPKRGEEVKTAIVTKQAQANLVAAGGGTPKGATSPKATGNNSALVAKYKAAGWSDDDIKELLT